MQRVEKFIEIDAPVERVFDLFSDFENFPQWMSHIKEVRRTGRRYTRWRADAPLGTSVEWEAETTAFDPDHRISWRSVRGDIDTDGEAIFEETRRGTTLLHVVLGYAPPAGRVGAAIARLFHNNPERNLEEDLEHFRDIVERRNRRDVRRDDRRREYREQPAQGLRPLSERDDRYYTERSYRYRYDQAERPPLRESKDYGEDEELRRERRMSEALREARRSQLEGQRRYWEERERDEARRRRSFEDEEPEEREQRLERRYETYEETDLAADDERLAYRRRYAMTPRERERELAERRPGTEVSERILRRGVDRLLDDDPPSRRWRRWD